MAPLWACYQSDGIGFWYFCRCMKMIKTSPINCTGNTHSDCLTCAAHWSNNAIRAPTPSGSHNPLFLFSAFSVDFKWKCLFLWPFLCKYSEDTKKNDFFFKVLTVHEDFHTGCQYRAVKKCLSYSLSQLIFSIIQSWCWCALGGIYISYNNYNSGRLARYLSFSTKCCSTNVMQIIETTYGTSVTGQLASLAHACSVFSDPLQAFVKDLELSHSHSKY